MNDEFQKFINHDLVVFSINIKQKLNKSINGKKILDSQKIG